MTRLLTWYREGKELERRKRSNTYSAKRLIRAASDSIRLLLKFGCSNVNILSVTAAAPSTIYYKDWGSGPVLRGWHARPVEDLLGNPVILGSTSRRQLLDRSRHPEAVES